MRDFDECKAFVEHLRLEHVEIHQAVGAVEQKLIRVDAMHDSTTLQNSLRQLRETLSEHFQEEEQGGCLEEAVSHAPQLSHEVASIEAEHVSIMRLLNRLIQRSDECHTADFREAFGRFSKILRHHETAESRVLQTAFGTGAMEDFESPYSFGG